MRTSIGQYFEATEPLWVVIITVVAFLIPYQSPIRFTESDPLGALLTSQAILKSGSVKLDAYAGHEYVPEIQEIGNTGKFRQRDGHCYYYFPLGTSLFSIPFVWLANLQGMDMLNAASDGDLQNLLSALTTAVAFILIYLIVRCFLDVGWSLFFSICFVFGSPLMSTMGTALWSMNLATTLILAILLLLVRTVRAGALLRPYLLGFFLIAAFVCRPTALLFAVPIGIYVLFHDRAALRRLLASITGFMAVFVCFSLAEYGRCLPEYYLPAKLPQSSQMLLIGVMAIAFLLFFAYLATRYVRFFVARRIAMTTAIILVIALLIVVSLVQLLPHLSFPNQRLPFLALHSMYGHILSPSRGVLVYSPYLIPTVIGLIWCFGRLRRNPLFWMSSAWLVLHLITISRPFRWWGGHCFGSRLFTEAFPGLALITVLCWEQLLTTRWRAKRVVIGVLFALGFLSVFFNTYQGLYNPNTATWNADPDIDEYPEYLFSWKYPQFLASPELLAERAIEHESRFRVEIAMKSLASYVIGDDITPNSSMVFFDDWCDIGIHEDEVSYRPSLERSAIWFWITGFERQHVNLVLEIEANSPGPRRVLVRINRMFVGSFRTDEATPSVHRLVFRDHLLRPHGRNLISFEVPNEEIARAGVSSCDEHVGFNLRGIRILPLRY